MKFCKYLALAVMVATTACDNTDTVPGEDDESLQRVSVTVIDYCPAPGQFVNVLPKYADGDSYDDIKRKVQNIFNGNDDNQVVTLGSCGGYIIVKTDRPISGPFQIIGNAIPTHAEPGVIQVSEDGKLWYTLRASGMEAPIVCDIRYRRPADDATDEDYIYYATSSGDKGYLSRIPDFHKQPYFPQWIEQGTEMTFTALRLPDNGYIDSKTLQWVLKPYEGYADSYPNSDPRSIITPRGVNLPESFSYIRISSGVLQNCGPLGEASTEVGGIKVYK